MKGFFSPGQTESKSRPQGKILSCAACGLYKDVLSPRMGPSGNFKKGILNVGEAPGQTEDRRGKQWQGKVGRTLQHMYQKFGIDLFEDCLNINAINCRPPDNRKPTPQEVSNCRGRVMKVIDEYRPKLIILFGESAVRSVIGHRWKKNLGSISKWRGWTIPDRDLHCWVCPCYHPSYMERGEREIETIWTQDLKRALGMSTIPFPKFPDETQQVIVIEDRDELTRVLTELAAGEFPPDPPILSLDIETTGKKPHADGHRIVSWSFCNNPGRAYSFPHPRRRSHIELLKKVLTSEIGKVAYSMKFEQTWINHFLNVPVNNWVFDPMLATHILDNREGITSLKFQVYVNFGVIDYASEIQSYLEGVDSKNANSKNRIEELLETEEGRANLLTYGGLDSLFTYKLAVKQMENIL